MLALSDDVGIIQHATGRVPDTSTGYCTDDVARALIVMLMRLQWVPNDRDAERLARIYLTFLQNAQIPDGRFHNFMSYERAWLDEVGTHDSCGRAIWSLGYAARFASHAEWRSLAERMLDRAIATIDWLEYPRAQAYAMLGFSHAQREAPLRRLAHELLAWYERGHGDGWEWFEPVMTYDNARLPEALLRAGAFLQEDRLLTIGAATLRFLEGIVFEDGIFVPIGNHGWFPYGGPRARFAQQPLEASAMLDAELAAFDASGNRAHLDAAANAAAWYDGKNLLGTSMAARGGCYDGLEADGPNHNMGAESTLAYLAASYAQE